MRDDTVLHEWDTWTPATHQQAVEEFMYEEAHGTDQQIQQMIEELDIQNHGSVASGERAAVAHKAHQKDDFIADLRTDGGGDSHVVQTKLNWAWDLERASAPSAHQAHSCLSCVSKSCRFFAFQAYHKVHRSQTISCAPVIKQCLCTAKTKLTHIEITIFEMNNF